MAGNTIELKDASFDTEVLQSDIPVLVDFWAEWCGPCRLIGPIVDELANDYAGRMKVGKVDVEANRAIAERYSIASIPTLMLFKNGELVERILGALPKASLKQAIDKHL